jgi:hypothetical protein
MTRRTIELEVQFVGDGRVVESPRGVFSGGVRAPKLGPTFGFNVLPETSDGEPGKPLEGTLQVNVWGTGGDYLELARYFLGLSELDSSADPGFHEHHDQLKGHGGAPTVNVIVRKPSQ